MITQIRHGQRPNQINPLEIKTFPNQNKARPNDSSSLPKKSGSLLLFFLIESLKSKNRTIRNHWTITSKIHQNKNPKFKLKANSGQTRKTEFSRPNESTEFTRPTKFTNNSLLLDFTKSLSHPSFSNFERIRCAIPRKTNLRISSQHKFALSLVIPNFRIQFSKPPFFLNDADLVRVGVRGGRTRSRVVIVWGWLRPLCWDEGRSVVRLK